MTDATDLTTAGPEEPTAATVPSSEAAPPPDTTVDRGAIGALRARDVDVSMGAIGVVRAERVSVELGAVGVAAARDLRLSAGGAGLLAAGEAHVEQAGIRTILAQRVTLGRGAFAGVVLTLRADGPGRPLLDWRGGLAAGGILALVMLLFRRSR